MVFPDSSVGKESACNAGDLGLIPGLGRFPGEGKGYPFQYSGLENSRDCIVHGVTKSRTQLNDFHQTLATTILSVQSLSHVRLFATPWAAAYQAPLSMGFSRQEYWSGLPFPSPKEGIGTGIFNLEP